MPPENDAISDGDSDDDEDALPKDFNHLGRGTLSQQAELVVFHLNAVDKLPYLFVVDRLPCCTMSWSRSLQCLLSALAMDRLRRWLWLRMRRSRRKTRFCQQAQGNQRNSAGK
jgi:hypothetical protein